MKITLLTSALVAILGLALVSAPVHAQTSNAATATTAPAASKKSATKTQYRGKITAIDASSVTVASSKKTLTLAIAPTTTYKVNKKAAAVTDFAVGDKVSGSYGKDATGVVTACSLNKKTAK